MYHCTASHYEIRTATILENLSEENFSSKGILVHSSLTPSPATKVQYSYLPQCPPATN